jgi:peptide/nickel transport system permease protein
MSDQVIPVRRAWRLPRIGYLGRSLPFVSGVAMLVLLLLFAGIGRLVIDTSLSEPLSAMPNQPPSWETPFGSDSQGRDLLAVLVLGTWLTMKVGLLAAGWASSSAALRGWSRPIAAASSTLPCAG